PAHTCRAARDARVWRTWKETCAAPRPPTARSRSSAPRPGCRSNPVPLKEHANERRHPARRCGGCEGDRAQTVSEGGVRARTGLRDDGAGVRKDQSVERSVQGGQKELVTVMADRGSLVHRTSVLLVADVLERFGEVRLRATGSSMWPSIGPGAELLVR